MKLLERHATYDAYKSKTEKKNEKEFEIFRFSWFHWTQQHRIDDDGGGGGDGGVVVFVVFLFSSKRLLETGVCCISYPYDNSETERHAVCSNYLVV